MAIRKRERILLMGALGVLGLLTADKFILEPLIADWKDRASSIHQMQDQIAKGEALLKRKDNLRARWRDMQKRSLTADRAAAESSVLGAVSKWAGQSALSITDLKPRWIDNEETGEQLEVRVSATGNMAAIARFLFELENDPLSVRLEDVELRSRDDKGKELALEARLTGIIVGTRPT